MTAADRTEITTYLTGLAGRAWRAEQAAEQAAGVPA
jgi:hypothetical protein